MSGRIHRLEINRNFVVIEDDIVNRPPYLSSREWLQVWERFAELNENYAPGRTNLHVSDDWRSRG